MDAEHSCLLCLDSTELEKRQPQKMKTIFETTKYLITCQCNSYIHNKCLHEWINAKWSCPICRKPIFLIINHPIYSNICYIYSPYIMILDLIYKCVAVYLLYNFLYFIFTL
jgi:hypothetical protein